MNRHTGMNAGQIIAAMGEASANKSGREFCAWLGLVPKQTGSGSKARLGGIFPSAATPTCALC